jgi:SAM-dependent methyltransferase
MSYECLLCKSKDMNTVVELKNIPIAHNLLASKDQSYNLFDLSYSICCKCGLVQNINPVPPDILYSGYNYNFSGWKFEPHFEKELDTIIAHGLPNSAFEIGSNDGKFLQGLFERGVKKAYGTEPNPAPYEVSTKLTNLCVFNSMITEAVADHAIDHNGGKFDLVCSRHVLEHVADLANFIKCSKKLLSDDGLLYIHVPDATGLLGLGDFSLLWEEHISFFTAVTLKKLLALHGFQVFEKHEYNFSGGTVAVLARSASARTGEMLSQDVESEIKLAQEFAEQGIKYGECLRALLEKARNRGYEVALYGVGGRASVQINAHGLGKLIDYALDDQPERQGKFLPGTGIHIRPGKSLSDGTSPVLMLLAVNNESEDKVIKAASAASDRVISYMSILGPKNIHDEIDKVNAELLSK